MGKLKFFMLIGLPASGKSTYCELMDLLGQRVSTDDYYDYLSERYGITYNEAFANPDNRKDAEKWMQDCLEHAIDNRKNIIWDQTNLSVKNRKKKLDKIPEDYYKVAIVFETPENHEFRLNNRPGKTIPPHVIENMKNSYEPPTLAEGFDLIYYVK